MQPEDRARHIVREAVKFFAEHGFEGQTRELARRAGITHPLLYRYFPTKDALIERVYEEVYLGRWKAEWDELLNDAAVPLKERLTRFYLDYLKATGSYEWMRIFMFAGLKGVNITRRYRTLIRRRVIVPLAAALRQLAGLPPVAQVPLSEAELEAAWGLHEQIIYIMIRRWVYKLPVTGSMERIIATSVAGFIDGAPDALKSLFRHKLRDHRLRLRKARGA